jgi:hypothetical protein
VIGARRSVWAPFSPLRELGSRFQRPKNRPRRFLEPAQKPRHRKSPGRPVRKSRGGPVRACYPARQGWPVPFACAAELRATSWRPPAETLFHDAVDITWPIQNSPGNFKIRNQTRIAPVNQSSQTDAQAFRFISFRGKSLGVGIICLHPCPYILILLHG